MSASKSTLFGKQVRGKFGTLISITMEARLWVAGAAQLCHRGMSATLNLRVVPMDFAV